MEAEQRLIAANARVAVARAAFFPSIQLTGMLGSEAQMLASLFSGPAGIWSFAAAVAAPIFAGGRLEAQIGAAEARAAALAATLRLSRLRYDNGLASQLDVIDAQRNLLAAEIARYEALRAQRAAVADLFKALGG